MNSRRAWLNSSPTQQLAPNRTTTRKRISSCEASTGGFATRFFRGAGTHLEICQLAGKLYGGCNPTGFAEAILKSMRYRLSLVAHAHFYFLQCRCNPAALGLELEAERMELLAGPAHRWDSKAASPLSSGTPKFRSEETIVSGLGEPGRCD